MSKQGVDYKQKYLQLRANYIKSLDLAFKTGYEKGLDDGEKRQQQQQMASMQQQMAGMQQAAAQQQPQDPQQMPQQEGQAPAEEQVTEEQQRELPADIQAAQMAQDQSGGHDLDSQIDELKQALGKAEGNHRDVLQKSLNALVIAKKHSDSFTYNTDDNGKKALSMQEKIVDGILKKWEEEEGKSNNVLSTIISTEALTKKE